MTHSLDLVGKPMIELWDTSGLGIIVEYPSGVLVSNQTGGTSCLHPFIEGIYIPLHNDYTDIEKEFLSPAVDLEEYFVGQKHMGTRATNGIDQEDVLKITEILTRYGLSDSISIDTDRLKQSHEAWVYVKIKNCYVLRNFPSELNGVLTWNNSD